MQRALILTTAALLAACGSGGDDAEPADDTSAGGETDTTVEVIPPDEPPDETAAPSAGAIAQVQPTEGNEVSGTVAFAQTDAGVTVTIDLTGLPPSSTHGFHVHETGDCSAPDGTSAGGHYNPGGHDHALPETDPRHAGDMGNLEADENGEVHVERTFATFSVDAEDPPPVVGRAVIVHADEDDGGQPTGNAGARVACGVIEAQ